MAGARSVALKALLRVDGEAGYSNLVLDSMLEAAKLESRDRALATALFYGVLEKRITLDYIIGLFSKLPVKKLSPTVREILRMGVYQIRYLEKIPSSAAVNESVTLAKKNGEFRSAGFVNAVLRAMLRSPEKIHLPDAAREPLRYRSVLYSCPEELVAFWRESYGPETADRILAGAASKPDVFIRVNNTRISEQKLIEKLRNEKIGVQPASWPDGALRVTENAAALPGSACYREGLFHVQDIASQLCCRVLDPQPGEHIIDVCAAPGGKTFTIAERMENRGEVTACDIYPQRARLIETGAERLGLTCVQARVRDAAEPKDSLPQVDRVLCDVPCSGLGVIRRKPEIRYKFPSTIDSLPDLQYLILCRSAELVVSGGTLVYSTCTLNPAENGKVAARFLAEHDGFEPAALRLPDGVNHIIEEPENQITLIPGEHGPDGFFISAFRKR
jgi:16S rRNA (cytosine967-C5)-methyltransferase